MMSGVFAFFLPKAAVVRKDGTAVRGPLYGLEYGAVWRRLAAGLVDGFLLTAGLFVLEIVGVAVSTSLDGATPHPLHSVNTGFTGTDRGATWIVLAVSLVTGWLYFALFESGEAQATLGKQLMRITVCDMSGHQITFWQASARWVVGVFVFLVPPLILLPVFTPKRQGLHDAVTETIVAAD